MKRMLVILTCAGALFTLAPWKQTSAKATESTAMDADSLDWIAGDAYADFVTQIPRINGDDVNLNFILDFEGFDSCVYYPGGSSGPTIGAGLDLGNMGRRNIDRFFSGVVSDSLLCILITADGKTATQAQEWIRKHPVSITHAQANQSLSRALNWYWRETKRRFPKIVQSDREMRGLVLSLCYSFGPFNPTLNQLDMIIAHNDAHALHAFVVHLAERAPLEGLRNRHNMQAAFVQAWSSGSGGESMD